MEYHNQHDLDIIERLLAVTAAVVVDHNKGDGILIDVSPTLNDVRNYLEEIRRPLEEPLRCAGLENIPAGMVPFWMLKDQRNNPDRIDVYQNGKTMCFCSPICLAGTFMRREGFNVLPKEDTLLRVN